MLPLFLFWLYYFQSCNLRIKIGELIARIEGIQKKFSLNHNRGLIKLESKLRKELDEILYQEEILWYKKSRVQWIKNGDRNTSYFHLSTITRRWNKIVAIKNKDNHWIHEQSKVKRYIMNFFSNLFTNDITDYSHDLC